MGKDKLPSKASLRFYMRSRKIGEVKAYLQYGGHRIYGGRTGITANQEVFATFNPDGTISKGDYEERKHIANDMLALYRQLEVIHYCVGQKVSQWLKDGVEITPDKFFEAMDYARETLVQCLLSISMQEAVKNGDAIAMTIKDGKLCIYGGEE